MNDNRFHELSLVTTFSERELKQVFNSLPQNENIDFTFDFIVKLSFTTGINIIQLTDDVVAILGKQNELL